MNEHDGIPCLLVRDRARLAGDHARRRPLGSVDEVQSDEELDIFHGLSVRVGIGRLPREVPSELVSAIEEGTITVAILSDEIGTLPNAD